MKKWILRIAAFIVIIGLICGTVILIRDRQENTIELRKGEIYAITIDGVVVVKDTSGAYWEINELTNENNSRLLLEIKGKELIRVWSLVAETEN